MLYFHLHIIELLNIEQRYKEKNAVGYRRSWNVLGFSRL